MKKGFAITTETLVIVVFLVVGFVLFLLIYSTLTAGSPNVINTFVNRLLDSLLGWFS